MKLTRRTMIATGAALAVASGAAGAAIAVTGGEDSQVTGPEADKAKAAALAGYPGARATAVERDNEGGGAWQVEVSRQDGTTVDVELDFAYKVVAAETDSDHGDDDHGDADGDGDETDEQGDDRGEQGEDRDEQATGPGADRARRAALARYPGATVTAVERDADDGALWEVEVTRKDGTTVEIDLDRAYKVVATDTDRGD
jgi:uncharacterized membrane protein YkoI